MLAETCSAGCTHSQRTSLDSFKQGEREGTCTAACCVLKDCSDTQRKDKDGLNGKGGLSTTWSGFCDKSRKQMTDL